MKPRSTSDSRAVEKEAGASGRRSHTHRAARGQSRRAACRGDRPARLARSPRPRRAPAGGASHRSPRHGRRAPPGACAGRACGRACRSRRSPTVSSSTNRRSGGRPCRTRSRAGCRANRPPRRRRSRVSSPLVRLRMTMRGRAFSRSRRTSQSFSTVAERTSTPGRCGTISSQCSRPGVASGVAMIR